jgi:hypothetical protein
MSTVAIAATHTNACARRVYLRPNRESPFKSRGAQPVVQAGRRASAAPLNFTLELSDLSAETCEVTIK